jgi:SAM-dependent methyltransferase
MEITRANWDARTPVHAVSEFYARDPELWFAEFEWADLGELRDRDVLHLQCHLGTETIALARRGARAVGLDFSAESVTQARRLAAEAGLNIEYVRANVYEALDALGGRRFDTIYTGKGALCYLPDLPAWADVVRGLLRPGGQLYVVEFHPLLDALGVTPPPDEATDLLLRNDYLGGTDAVRHDSARTYTDGPALPGETVSYQWPHGLAEVVGAVLGAGLRPTGLRETPLLPWKRWPRMVPAEGGWWRLPDSDPHIPLLYALRATHD